MKKSLIVTAVVVVVALVVGYFIANRAPKADLPLNDAVVAIFEDGGCMACHSANPDLPFYFDLPIAGDIVMKDVEEGYRAFDMEPMMKVLLSGEGELSPVDVAKVEKVALDKRMPMAKYFLVHWGSQMTSAKRDIIVSWARDEREAYYADNVVAERVGEPIRPIPQSYDVDAAKVELGRLLYHDTRLSVDNTVSCASCHDLESAGVDNKQYSEGVAGVYVVQGSIIKFKPIEIVHRTDNFTLCKKSEDGNTNSVVLYDEVVEKGRDLYDGKFID